MVQRALVYALKKAITKEGLEKCLSLLAGHIDSTENKVDDEIFRVFGPAASHLLAGAKQDMASSEYEELVFDALEIAAAATQATWDDVVVEVARAAAPAARRAGRKK